MWARNVPLSIVNKDSEFPRLLEVYSHAMSDSVCVCVFAEWSAFAVEDVLCFPLLDTGALRTVDGYTMVQHVIDNL